MILYMLKNFINIKINPIYENILKFWKKDFDASLSKHINFLKKNVENQEIYNSKFSEILEAVVVETNDNSESTVTLFLKLDKDKKLTEELIEQIKHRLKTYASPKHVPTNIIQVDDIPKTISGKISELSVKSAIEGKKIKNIEALSNPD